MILNSRQDKLLAIFMLVSCTVLMLYQSKTFIPGWIYHMGNMQGIARITDRGEIDNVKFISYTYFNEYLDKSVTNRRQVNDLRKWETYQSKDIFDISYAKCLETYVVFDSIDKLPFFGVTILFYIIELIGIYYIISVLRDKTALKDLLGVK